MSLAIPNKEWRRLFLEIERVLAPDGRLELIDDELFFPYMDLPPPPRQMTTLPDTPAKLSTARPISMIDRDLDPAFDDEDEDEDLLSDKRQSSGDGHYDSDVSSNSSTPKRPSIHRQSKRQSDSSSSSRSSQGDPRAEFDRSLEVSHALEALHAAALREKWGIEPHPSVLNRRMMERDLVIAFGKDCVRKSKEHRICLPSKKWVEDMKPAKAEEREKKNTWPLKDKEDTASSSSKTKGSVRGRKLSELGDASPKVPLATTTSAFAIPLSTSPPSFLPLSTSAPGSNASTVTFHASANQNSRMAPPLPSTPPTTSVKAAKLLGAAVPTPTKPTPPPSPPFYSPPYQPNGLVLWPDVFLPMDEEEVEMHATKNLQVLMSSGRFLKEYVRENVEKEIQIQGEIDGGEVWSVAEELTGLRAMLSEYAS